LPTRGLGEVAGAAVTQIDVDDQRRPGPLLVERRCLGELLRPSAERGEAARPVSSGQRDRVVDG